MNPPRRDWGLATVNVPWTRPETWMNGIVLPRDYELAGEYGAFFANPVGMGWTLVVTGPDIPKTEEAEEFPRLRTDSSTWQKVVVYPYGG